MPRHRPGMNNLTVIFDPSQDDAELWLERLRRHWSETKASTFSQRRIIIPPTIWQNLGSPDLAIVAEHAELSPSRVRLQRAHYRLFPRFQPGFAYGVAFHKDSGMPRHAGTTLVGTSGVASAAIKREFIQVKVQAVGN